MEEVKEFSYLGYKLQRNGGQEGQIKERIRKAAVVMGQVWGLGKRRFGKDYGRRLWLFDKLVWTVLSWRDLGMEGMGGNGKDRRKIFKMNVGSGYEDARLYGKGGIAERKAESKSRYESLGF